MGYSDTTVSLLSECFGSNSHSTRDILIHTNRSEGLVHRLGWIYNFSSLSHFLNALNSDDKTAGEFARSSRFLDMRRAEVLVPQSQPAFLTASKQNAAQEDSDRCQTDLTPVTSVEFVSGPSD
ncbi:hypothetical protein VZT92_007156 [Zoarces viviparus]|uniref:Uncharacterized protein n=1 Tax=Zoarces viviparus TaxID=48416 RepID=A0AAW1FJ37_ZOAVI